MYSDYHVHSCFSFDSKESPEEIIKKALSLGMKQICFTDHQDYNWPVAGESPLIDLEKYTSTLNGLKEEYAGKIEVLKGIELGLAHENKDNIESLLSKYQFDFIIGSCHMVSNMDPYYSEYWKNKTDRKAFEEYFTATLAALKSFSAIHTLGHLDYIIRYSPNKDTNYSVADYLDILDEILNFIIQKEICLEINTASLGKGFQYPHPHPDILKRYHELGGNKVTIGSDAHCSGNVGFGFSEVEKVIKKYNFEVFHK